MDDELDQLLKNLRLRKLREVIERELAKAEKSGPSYRDFVVNLLRQEYHSQQERFLEYRIRRAQLPERWSLESFPWKRQPGVKKARILQLAELDFIPRAQNLVFIGETGVGKSGLAMSILRKALENGYRGLFILAQDLFDDMYTSLADRSSRQLLNRLVGRAIFADTNAVVSEHEYGWILRQSSHANCAPHIIGEDQECSSVSPG